MLTLWAKRDTHGKRLAIAAAALVVVWGGYYVLVSRPASLSTERARIELTETLPKALRLARADVMAVANDGVAKQKAAALLADGERAVRTGDRVTISKVTSELNALRDEVTQEYTLTIVLRPDESSGVWRRPPRGNQARNSDRLRKERGEGLRELARIKLDEMTASRLVSNLDAGERRAMQIVDDHRMRLVAATEQRDARPG